MLEDVCHGIFVVDVGTVHERAFRDGDESNCDVFQVPGGAWFEHVGAGKVWAAPSPFKIALTAPHISSPGITLAA